MDIETKGEGARDKVPAAPKVFDLPEPEVKSTPFPVEELPRGAKTVVNSACSNGWTVITTYSRGPYINSDGSLNRIADCIMAIGVRIGQASAQKPWAAKWVTDAKGDYKFESAHILGVLGLISSPDLKTYIKEGE